MSKNGVNLEDLLPQKPEATIGGKVYSFRAPSLADDVWIKANIGGTDQLKEMVNKLHWEGISKLAYHLIDDNGRRDFRARSATIISEGTGEEVQRMLTGPEELLRNLDGVQVGVQVVGAIVRAMANANPMIGDLVKKSLEEARAILAEQNKEAKKAPLTGRKSSTRSQVNTSGRKGKSKR